MCIMPAHVSITEKCVYSAVLTLETFLPITHIKSNADELEEYHHGMTHCQY